jgi:hypothetical protein
VPKNPEGRSTSHLTRADSLHGLRELLSAHQDLLNSSASQIISGCCKMLVDEVSLINMRKNLNLKTRKDTSVRRALAEFLDWYLHRLEKVLTVRTD